MRIRTVDRAPVDIAGLDLAQQRATGLPVDAGEVVDEQLDRPRTWAPSCW